MTTSDVARVYLKVPFAQNEQAKQHGARWDALLQKWWIERRLVAANPGVHRWMTAADAVLAAKAKEAFEFLTGSRPSSEKAGRTRLKKRMKSRKAAVPTKAKVPQQSRAESVTGGACGTRRQTDPGGHERGV